jgi:S-adenosylmethionine:tRNA ribosyltransferase-isomerase
VKTADFDYTLPPEQIAQTPVEPRDSARLMVLDRSTGEIEHRIFHDLGDYLLPGDLLILNDTRVIPARLYARKVPTGGRVEILLLEQTGVLTWRALVGGRKVRVGTNLELVDSPPVRAEIQALEDGGQRIIVFDRPTSEWLNELGHTPLPPYIHGYRGDPERYQTVYSRREGSAAAPTAGLHFTADLLLSLLEMGVKLAYVTLRIGLDTFKPLDTADIRDHKIHTEWAQLDASVAKQINETKLAGGRIIAVGTTAVRTLETGALGANPAGCEDSQCRWSTVAAFEGPTDLYITPGFRFRAVDALITNFHLPRSTLIVLVSAFAGRDTIKHAYATAIDQDYRFYSFGDAMLIL